MREIYIYIHILMKQTPSRRRCSRDEFNFQSFIACIAIETLLFYFLFFLGGGAEVDCAFIGFLEYAEGILGCS